MKVLNKIKNWFVEEYEDEEEEEEELPVGEQEVAPPLARKVEVPKKSFRERFMHQEEEEEVEEEKDIPLEITEVPVTAPPVNNRIITLEEEEFKPPVEEKKEEIEVPMEEEEEEEFPSRSTRIPLVFEDNDLFQEEEEENVKEPPKEIIDKPLYQGKKESTYLSSMKKETYHEPVENRSNTKFRPSPIISPIYGILDKNYKKEEIVSREEKVSGLVDSSIDNVRKKAYGEPVKEEKKEVPKEKKVNVNNEKPGVSKVTIADADEYYNDLGLAYNVDYKDMSRSNNQSRKKEEVIEDKNDDNLFDLIDSMYKKED